MKKHILFTAFLFAGLYSATAQQSGLKPPPPGGPSAKCDSLSVDSVSVIAPGTLQIFLHNKSSITAALPGLKAELDPNAYMALDTNTVTASTLNDSITNAGITLFTVSIASVSSADSIPLNTVFSGTAHIVDPGDSIIRCDIPFTFTYGNRLAQAVHEIASQPVYVIADNNQLIVKGNIQNSTMQIINIAGQLLVSDNRNSSTNVRTLSIANLPSGMYFLSIQKDNERIVRRFLKN